MRIVDFGKDSGVILSFLLIKRKKVGLFVRLKLEKGGGGGGGGHSDTNGIGLLQTVAGYGHMVRFDGWMDLDQRVALWKWIHFKSVVNVCGGLLDVSRSTWG